MTSDQAENQIMDWPWPFSQADLAAPKRAVCGVVVIRVVCKIVFGQISAALSPLILPVSPGCSKVLLWHFA